MAYLYHIAREYMQGNILYPLNTLKHKIPKVYDLRIKKYENRETLLKTKIPILNCLWNDVVQFIPVDPKKLKKIVKGTKWEKEMPKKWFKIKAEALGPNKTIIYLFREPTGDYKNLTKKDLVKYNPKEISTYNKIPEKTKHAFEYCRKHKKNPPLFIHIPHILYRGTIDISKAEVIEIN